MTQMWIKIASSFMLAGVGLGAFAAHALKNKLTEHYLDVFKTGVNYHFIHALGLFVVAWLTTQSPNPKIATAGWFFTIGIALFSGSLYLVATTPMKWLGFVTPVGGLCFMIGWGLLIFAQ